MRKLKFYSNGLLLNYSTSVLQYLVNTVYQKAANCSRRRQQVHGGAAGVTQYKVTTSTNMVQNIVLNMIGVVENTPFGIQEKCLCSVIQ